MRDNQSHSIPRIVTATTLGEILSLMELAMQYTVVIHSDTQMQTSVTASIVKNLIRKLISNHFGWLDADFDHSNGRWKIDTSSKKYIPVKASCQSSSVEWDKTVIVPPTHMNHT